jgi:hypothetical protein
MIFLGSSGSETGMWVARLGNFILGVVWLIKILGRLEDAGRSPRMGQGLYVVCGVLLIRIFRRLMGVGASSQSYGSPFADVAHIASMLPPWIKLTNGYEILAFFLLIQVPLAFLPSKPRFAEPVFGDSCLEDGSKKTVPVVRTNEISRSGPLEYLRILFVITCFWILLIYMDDASGGSVGSWIARLGYFILGFFWLTFANGRLEDAGWAHSWYPSQYGLVISVVSLMPLAIHWVNGYEALVIFFLVQTPTALLPSKPKPEEPILQSAM